MLWITQNYRLCRQREANTPHTEHILKTIFTATSTTSNMNVSPRVVIKCFMTTTMSSKFWFTHSSVTKVLPFIWAIFVSTDSKSVSTFSCNTSILIFGTTPCAFDLFFFVHAHQQHILVQHSSSSSRCMVTAAATRIDHRQVDEKNTRRDHPSPRSTIVLLLLCCRYSSSGHGEEQRRGFIGIVVVV